MKLLLLTFFAALYVGCQGDSPPTSEDKLVASVYDKQLYKSHLDSLLINPTNPEDSLNLIHAYIETWIRDNLILHEAEKNIPRDLDINKLVDDYRNSLLKFHYEKSIIEEQLDTIISSAELDTFYQKNKEQYLLREPIVLCQAAKIDKTKKDSEQLVNWWKAGNEERSKSYVTTNAESYIWDNSWVKQSQLSEVIPLDIFEIKKLGKKELHQKTKDTSKYYLKIVNFKDKNEVPPLSYIQDQLRKVILHNRKQIILKRIKEDLYEEESRKNNVKVY